LIEVHEMIKPLDTTDLALIATLRREPRASHAQLARSTGLARGTVYSRLERLESDGVITGYGPDIEAAEVGLGVLAFCTLEISQGSLDATTRRLTAIPQVLEIHTVTGPGDLLCRIVARSNDHLHDVLQRIAAIDTVLKSQTHLSLATNLHRTIADMLASD
jgi:DNA-binding Lrp family transcriptional regulator